MAVPGCPDPAASTASIASTRIRSTARESVSDQSRVACTSPLTLSLPLSPRTPLRHDPIPGAGDADCQSVRLYSGAFWLTAHVEASGSGSATDAVMPGNE